MTDFIGIVDLTVRHSSMNPLGYINVRDASVRFEQLILYSCAEALDRHGPTDPRTQKMLERGIVTQGGAAKHFQFEHADDAVAFATYLRSLLIEKQLPFKLCLTRGTLGAPMVRDVWASDLAALGHADGADRRDIERRLIKQFGTASPQRIEQLFRAYQAPGFDDDEISLALDLDAFKGFGIWIDRELSNADPDVFDDDRLFRNFHPGSTTTSRTRLHEPDFIDIRFDLDPDDVTIRSSIDPTYLPSGQNARIASVIDLLRRSLKAGDENAVHYVSLLTTIVRSSHFGKMQHLDKAKPAKGENPALRAGWQGHPPIFQTILVDAGARQLFRRIPALELVLGATIDEIHAAITGEPPSCRIKPYRRETAALDAAARQALATRLADALKPDGVFALAVKEIERIYGEQVLRRIWAVPDGVLNAERKRAALRVTTER